MTTTQTAQLAADQIRSVYRNMTDQDLGAIYAYLRTVPAIRNQVPEPLAPPEMKVATK